MKGGTFTALDEGKVTTCEYRIMFVSGMGFVRLGVVRSGSWTLQDPLVGG